MCITGYLNTKKRQILSKEVIDAICNTKKLYKLVTSMMGTNSVNPLTPAHLDEDLANRFADFFENKILKIHDRFHGTIPFNPTIREDVPRLRRFTSMTESQVRNIVASMKSKSCKLDTIPATLLKRLLPVCIPKLTNIVNLSFSNGEFCQKWKTSTVRSLLKRQIYHKKTKTID